MIHSNDLYQSYKHNSEDFRCYPQRVQGHIKMPYKFKSMNVPSDCYNLVHPRKSQKATMNPLQTEPNRSQLKANKCGRSQNSQTKTNET